MNATVTKSTKKSVAAKSAGGTGVKMAAKAAAKSPVKSTLKTVASKLVKTIKGVLKPASRATKPIKDAIKSEAKPAAEAASKNAMKTPSKASAARISEVTENVRGNAKRATRATLSGARKNATIANAGLEDKTETTVVSKVSKVATKSSKSTTAVPSDGALLTEAQIMKMSDKDYMNPAQRAFFKARLRQLEKDLLKNAGETTEHLRETVLVPDPADRATIEEEHALELRTRDRERKLLKKVQQSIASIESGDYGWCEETGEPIGIPRLMARPTATLSLEAQQRRELKQKLYGD
jgi:DnaK suppressor protein